MRASANGGSFAKNGIISFELIVDPWLRPSGSLCKDRQNKYFATSDDWLLLPFVSFVLEE